jgi:hypothetical protein
VLFLFLVKTVQALFYAFLPYISLYLPSNLSIYGLSSHVLQMLFLRLNFLSSLFSLSFHNSVLLTICSFPLTKFSSHFNLCCVEHKNKIKSLLTLTLLKLVRISSYLKETQCFQFTRISRLILFSVIIVIYSDINTRNNEQRDITENPKLAFWRYLVLVSTGTPAILMKDICGLLHTLYECTGRVCALWFSDIRFLPNYLNS